MRAIVSLLKFFVGFSFLLYTVFLAFVLGGSLFGFTQGWWAVLGAAGTYFAVASFVILVLFTGMIALMISAHDRLNDIALLMAERNELLRDRVVSSPDF